MKKCFMLSIVALSVIFLNFSCSKDHSMQGEDSSSAFSATFNTVLYDQGGELVKKALAVSLNSPEFRKLVYEQANLRDDGDTEFLLKHIINKEIQGKKVNTFIVQEYNSYFSDSDFTGSYLDNFLAAFPTFLVGVRGDLEGWDFQNYAPSVVFASSKFKESDKEIAAVNSQGEGTTQDLTKDLANVMVALHISERHDKNGVNLYKKSLLSNTIQSQVNPNNPTVGIDDVAANFRTCGPEPESCNWQLIPPTITNVVVSQSGLTVTYARAPIGNDGLENCYWAKYGWLLSSSNGVVAGDLSTVGFGQNGGEAPVLHIPAYFLNPNTTYSLVMNTKLYAGGAYCVSDDLSNVQTFTTPNDMTNPITNLNGLNLTQYSIDYTWNNPPNSTGTQVELYSNVSHQWQQAANLQQGDIDYTQHYPNSEKGKLQWMRTRAKGAFGTLSNPTYTASFAGWRNNGQSLNLEGFRVENISLLEEAGAESLVCGLPEFYLSASSS